MYDRNKIFFGCWGLVSNWNIGDINIYNIKNLIIDSNSYGIKKFDTAIVYGNGLGERIFSHLNDDVYISTKIPAKIKPNDNIYGIEKYYDQNYIIDSVNKSLENLSKTYIDLVFLHNWSEKWDKDIDYVLKPLKELKNRGIIKNIGISLPDNYTGNCKIISESGIDYLQIPHNILNEDILGTNYNYFKNNNIKVLIRSIFAQGVIFNDFEKLNSNDLRLNRYKDINYIKTYVKEFMQINNLITKKDLYNFILNKYMNDDRIDNIIVGIKDKKQLKDLIYFLGK